MANAIQRLNRKKRSGSPRIVDKGSWNKGRSDPYYGVGGKFKAGATEVITRYFTEVAEASSQSWTLDSQTQLVGDFKFTFTSTSVVGKSNRILGTSSNFGSFIGLKSDKMIATVNFVNGNVNGTYDLEEGEFLDWEIERIGSSITWTKNGVLQATNASAGTDDFFFQTISGIGGSTFSNGILGDLKVYSVGTLVHSWAIDEEDPSTIVDSVGSNNGTGNNITSADADLYQFVGDTWVAV